MIKITASAARQIKASANQGQMGGLAMRIAATQNSDGSIHYGMGFDENSLDEDTQLNADGIDLVISKTSEPLLAGMTLDYVEIEPGNHQFIFMNPNDPNYNPPEEKG